MPSLAQPSLAEPRRVCTPTPWYLAHRPVIQCARVQGYAVGGSLSLVLEVARQKRLNGRPLRRTLAGTEDEIALALGRA